MNKILFQSELCRAKFLRDIPERDAKPCRMRDALRSLGSPASYPCVLVWSTKSDSNAWLRLISEYVYAGDFLTDK